MAKSGRRWITIPHLRAAPEVKTTFTAFIPPDLKKAVEMLPDAMRQNAAVVSLRFGLRVVRDQARRQMRRHFLGEGRSPTPPSFRQRPHLYEQIHQNAFKGKKHLALSYVGYSPSRTTAAHANLVEFGTKGHTIRAGKLRGANTGKKILVGPPGDGRGPGPRPRDFLTGRKFGPVVRHPGAKPGLLLTNAFRLNQGRIVSRFLQKMRQQVPKELRKLARKLAVKEIRSQLGRVPGTRVKAQVM